MKLEEIVGYLPYKLKIKDNFMKCIIDLKGIAENGDLIFNWNNINYSRLSDCNIITNNVDIKPILRPISDLKKEINIDGVNDCIGFTPIEKLAKLNNYTNSEDFKFDGQNFTYTNMKYFDDDYLNSGTQVCPESIDMIQLLYKWHFDIHGLIEKGEAIDINTLEGK